MFHRHEQDIKYDFGQMTQETGINKSPRHLNEFLIKIQIGGKKRMRQKRKRKHKFLAMSESNKIFSISKHLKLSHLLLWVNTTNKQN